MNLLDLVKRLAVEAGASGGGPTSAVGQSGESLRLVNWIKSAWQDLQLHNPAWYWMRGSFSFHTTTGVGAYDSTAAGILTRFSSWDQNSIVLFQSSKADERALAAEEYPRFFRRFLVGLPSDGRPDTFSIAPDLKLLIGPAPDGAYTLGGDYLKSPQDLLLDADVPELPEPYHMAIVYRALMLYARYESAPEVMADAQANYKRFLRRMMLNQTPLMAFSEGLA